MEAVGRRSPTHAWRTAAALEVVSVGRDPFLALCITTGSCMRRCPARGGRVLLNLAALRVDAYSLAAAQIRPRRWSWQRSNLQRGRCG